MHWRGGSTHGKSLCRFVFFALVTLCLKLAFDLPSSLTLSRRSCSASGSTGTREPPPSDPTEGLQDRTRGKVRDSSRCLSSARSGSCTTKIMSAPAFHWVKASSLHLRLHPIYLQRNRDDMPLLCIASKAAKSAVEIAACDCTESHITVTESCSSNAILVPAQPSRFFSSGVVPGWSNFLVCSVIISTHQKKWLDQVCFFAEMVWCRAQHDDPLAPFVAIAVSPVEELHRGEGIPFSPSETVAQADGRIHDL